MKQPLVTITASDCRWDYYRASGPGGQKRNKTNSAVRCTHEPSGAVGQASDTRSQTRNRQLAFRRMAESEKFRQWVRIESARKTGMLEKIERAVERSMDPNNLRVEGKQDGRWHGLRSDELVGLTDQA